MFKKQDRFRFECDSVFWFFFILSELAGLWDQKNINLNTGVDQKNKNKKKKEMEDKIYWKDDCHLKW